MKLNLNFIISIVIILGLLTYFKSTNITLVEGFSPSNLDVEKEAEITNLIDNIQTNITQLKETSEISENITNKVDARTYLSVRSLYSINQDYQTLEDMVSDRERSYLNGIRNTFIDDLNIIINDTINLYIRILDSDLSIEKVDVETFFNPYFQNVLETLSVFELSDDSINERTNRILNSIANLLNESEKSNENNKGKNNKGENNKGENNKGENNKGENNKGENNKGENNKGENNKGENNKEENNKGENNKGENNKESEDENLNSIIEETGSILSPRESKRVPGESIISPGLSERVPGETVRAPGLSERVTGETVKAPGLSERVPGETVKAPGLSERVPGETARAPGLSERVPGETVRAPGSSTLNTSLEPVDSSLNLSTENITPGSSRRNMSPGVSNNDNQKIDEDLLMEEMLNILNSLNKRKLSEQDKKKINESLDYIENIIINSDRSQFSDSNKFSLLMKLLSENRKLLTRKNNDSDEMEAIRSTFGSGGNYTKQPSIPNIAQFKPSGTSNIFSPIIEVNSSPFRNNNNKRYSNAYEKGFEKGLKEAKTTLGETNVIDQSTGNSSKKVSIGNTTYHKSFRDINLHGEQTVGYKDADAEDSFHKRNSGKSTASDNGYIRKDNGKVIQKPGYSYLDPKLWNLPRKRTPVCFSRGDMDRKENSLDPAGFVFGGPSNVMEFHGVGSILPKFAYKEDMEEVESSPDL